PRALPRILCQTGTHFVGSLGRRDEQRVRGPFEWAAEDHESLFREGVHERGMAGPVSLALQRPGLLPGRAARTNHGEQLRHRSPCGLTPRGEVAVVHRRAAEPALWEQGIARDHTDTL